MKIKNIQRGKEYKIITDGKGTLHNLQYGEIVKALEFRNSVSLEAPAYVEVRVTNRDSDKHMLFQVVRPEDLGEIE